MRAFLGNLLFWRGKAIPAANVDGRPLVDVTHVLGGAVPTPNVTGRPLADVTHWLGSAVAANVGGRPLVDVGHLAGGAVPAPNVTGRPLVDLTHWNGNVLVQNVAGRPAVDTTHFGGSAGVFSGGRPEVIVQTNNDKTGYSLTAGSYSVRASSTQRGIITLPNTGGTQLENTATIASVTTTRAKGLHQGSDNAVASDAGIRLVVTNSTTLTATRGITGGGEADQSFEVEELF